MENQEVRTGELLTKTIFQPRRNNLLDVNSVIKALSAREVNIELTPEEKERFGAVPFSEETMKMAANRQWRGKRAILWWAPPQRYEITMIKLLDAFGASRKVQPCIYNIKGWLEEDFAKEVLREGWHLTLIELPDESRDKTYEKQKALLNNGEELLAPVEAMYLCLIHYLISEGERLLYDCYSRTNRGTVCLGYFHLDGFEIFHCDPDYPSFHLGILIAKKPGL